MITLDKTRILDQQMKEEHRMLTTFLIPIYCSYQQILDLVKKTFEFLKSLVYFIIGLYYKNILIII
jgi:hypothetical protein